MALAQRLIDLDNVKKLKLPNKTLTSEEKRIYILNVNMQSEKKSTNAFYNSQTNFKHLHLSMIGAKYEKHMYLCIYGLIKIVLVI